MSPRMSNRASSASAAVIISLMAVFPGAHSFAQKADPAPTLPPDSASDSASDPLAPSSLTSSSGAESASGSGTASGSGASPGSVPGTTPGPDEDIRDIRGPKGM